MTHRAILIDHSVPTMTTDSGRVLALEQWSVTQRDGTVDHHERWLDVTDFSRRELLHWLGY